MKVEPQIAETGKSGAFGALWGLALYVWTYLGGIGWDFTAFDLAQFMEGVETYLGAGGLAAVWWRSRRSPVQDAADRKRPAPPPAIGAPSYFLRAEFECKGMKCDCESPAMDSRLLQIMNDDVRAVFGPTVINSGYRCPVHNAQVGGVTDSYHMKGMAADFRVPGVDPKEVYDYLDAKYPGELGLGLYSWGVHVDTRRGSAARKRGPGEPWERLPDIELN